MSIKRQSSQSAQQLSRENILRLMERSRRLLAGAFTPPLSEGEPLQSLPVPPISSLSGSASIPAGPRLSIIQSLKKSNSPKNSGQRSPLPGSSGSTSYRSRVIYYGEQATPYGKSLMATTEGAICYLAFPKEEEKEDLLREISSLWDNAELRFAPQKSADLVEQIFFNDGSSSISKKSKKDRGKRDPIRLILRGTPFQQQVWQSLAQIPVGHLLCYEYLAEMAGKKSAVRAVARAVAQNPISFLIPCHRIVRKEGDINQYRWGRSLKVAIIQKELHEQGQLYKHG